MKFLSTFLLLGIFVGISIHVNAQTYFYEGFENRVYPPDNTTLPPGWTQTHVSGTVTWEFQNGGHTKYPQYPYTRKPYPAHGGSYNALFQKETFSRPVTKLITPPINISYSSKPMLVFWHAQASRFFFNNWTNDELRVYYRTSTTGTWNLLAEYTSAVENWTERQILLPNEAKSTTLYIAFEGRSMPGWGTCVDDISIIETDTIPKTVESITIASPLNTHMGRSEQDVLLMRLDIAVKGNQGSLIFDSLYLNYTGTNVVDISTNGIRLYKTSDSVFIDQTLLAQGSFSGTSALLKFNEFLQPGMSFYWIALNISSTATVGNTVKVEIPAHGVRISGKRYPSSTLSLGITRSIVRTIFYDGFESNKGWSLSGDFERAAPQGKGGLRGNPDPALAFSGTYVLGNDLTDDGDYEPDMSIAHAISPVINCRYFKNVNLKFKRWLNTDLVDIAAIDVSGDNGLNWQNIYSSTNYVVDKQWYDVNYNISNQATRKNQVKIRFKLGPTNSIWEFSGWNIDNVLVYGDTIIYDAAISRIVAPITNCGLTSTEDVKVWVVNEGSAVTPPSVPIAFSINNGVTWQYDTIKTNIPIGDSILFTFSPKANLSTAGTYNIKVKIDWESDDYNPNDTVSTVIKSIPTYNLPFADDFESSTTFWSSGGENNTWQWGIPSSDSIHSAHSGGIAWKTSLFGYYNDNEDSYVESPCFNLNDTSKIIVDFYCYKLIEGNDGVALYYTTDGNTWSKVPSHSYSWSWNWYNNSNISLLGGEGWDGYSDDWLQAKQVLPVTLNNQSQVRFRMVLKSDDDFYTNEGFAFDDFKIYKAPLNIQLNSITSHSSACEGTLPQKITFSITNNGIRTLVPTNDKIIAAFKLNNFSDVIDTITLPSNLPVGQTINITFNKSIGKLSAGNYTLKVYHIDPNKGFYPVTDNDTLTINFEVYPAPVSGLKKEYATARLDTFTIVANNVANCSYQWANEYNSNLSITNSLSNPPAGNIWLTMQDTTGNLCSTTDTFYMRKLIPDVGIVAFKEPTDACEFPQPVKMKVVIKNLGTDTLSVQDSLKIIYIDHLNNQNTDTLILTSRFFPNDTIEHICFKNSLDLSAMNQSYTLKAFTKYKYDSIPANDTLQIVVNAWGYPTVTLGSDRTTAGYDTLVLTGYKTYLWSDNSSDSVYIARYRGDHWVHITDEHDCPASDTVHINVVAHDLKPLLWASPLSACSLGTSENLILKLKNVGTDTIIPGEKTYIRYTINNGLEILDSLEFSSELLPYDTIEFQLSQPYNFSALGSYSIFLYIQLAGDIDVTNDTLRTTIYHYGYPVVELGPDYTIKALYDTLDAGEGTHWYYTWHDNSHDRTIVLDNTILAKVTVTDTISGCATSDSVFVTFEKRNGAITQSNLPIEICHGQLNSVQVEFTNVGNLNISAGDTVLLGYKINNTLFSPDTIKLMNNLTPGAKILHILTGFKDLLDTGSNIVKFYCILNNDIQQSNDTLVNNITVHVTPYVNFSAINDTIISTPPYILEGPVGDNFLYTWTPSHSGSSYSVTATGWYKLKVETPYGCTDSSRVYVDIFVPDGGITSVLSEPSACAGDFDTATVVFQNLGTTIIPQGTVLTLICKVGNKPEKIDSVIVTRNLLPPQGSNAGDTIHHTFRNLKNLVSMGLNNIKYYSFYSEDIKSNNDTAYTQVEINSKPPINLESGRDTVEFFPESTLSSNLGSSFEYLWNTGETTEQITIYSEGKYWVRATNTTTGCSNSDTIYVRIVNYDLTITQVDLPSAICYHAFDSVTVEITNVGDLPYDPGTDITISYITDQMKSASSTIILEDYMMPASKLYVKIGKIAENLTPGIRTIKFIPVVTFETNPDNDTLTINTDITDWPHIDFGTTTDTIAGLSPLTIPSGLDKNSHTFLWSNGETSDTIQVNSSGYYWVEVTSNTTGCVRRDTIYAHIRIPDGTITSVNGTSGICSNELNTLDITIKNNGNENISSGTMVRVAILADNKVAVIDTSYLSSSLAIAESRTITINNLENKIFAHDPLLKLVLLLPEDVVKGNDTFYYSSGLKPSYRNEVSASICEGDTYILPSGTPVTTTGTYTSNFNTILGCDSIIITHLTVHPVYDIEQSKTICEGESYLGHTISGTYVDTLFTIMGCDSIITTHLTVNPSYYITDTIDICEGSSYKGHSTSGTYYENLTTYLGCDSIITTVLRVHPIYNIEQDVYICIGESYNGHSTSGTYTDHFTSRWGCDSIVTTHLTIGYRANVIDTAICEGESFMGRSVSGTYYDTIPMSPGCDSLIILNLTVHPVPKFHLADGSSEITTYFPYTITVNFDNNEEPEEYNYLWNNSDTTKDLMVNFAGTYQIEITHKITKCSANKQIILHQPEEYDLTPFAFEDYSSNSCSGAINPLTVVIKNIGNTYIPQGSDINVKLKVNNQLKKDEVVHLNSPLLKNTQVNHNFGDIGNYLILGNNSIIVEVNVVGDINTSNNTKSATIVQNSSPTLELESGKDTIIFYTSTYTIDGGAGYDTYLWNTGSVGRFLVVSQSGNYWLKVTRNGCATTDTIYVKKATSIEKNTPMYVDIYPNPAKDILTIRSSNYLTNAAFEVFSIEGILILREKIYKPVQIHYIDVSSWKRGMYILRFNNGDLIQNIFFVVQ